ncbi:MAG: hypothetical protein KA914_04835 [Ottowia sp.]|nr:hypothetical protein [Ottowia sp.]
MNRPLFTIAGALAAAATVALMAGCAATPADGAAASAQPAAAPARAGQDPKPPKVVNRTPFEYLTLTGVDKFGEYTSLALKITYAVQADGTLRPTTTDQELFIDEHTPHADDYDCRPHGGGFNQRTTFFSDTGVFVSGGSLTGLRDGKGAARPLLGLTEGDRGIMGVTGPGARETEYVYVPCVGSQRVHTGARTVGYVMPGDRLQVRPSARGAKPQTIVMPAHPRPYVALEFAGRKARAIAPANIVLLTVDVPRRRVVAQYQVTVAMQPQVSLADWLAVLPTEALSKDKAGLREVNQAVADYIETCIPPRKPMDPCTNPHGQLPEVLRR